MASVNSSISHGLFAKNGNRRSAKRSPIITNLSLQLKPYKDTPKSSKSNKLKQEYISLNQNYKDHFVPPLQIEKVKSTNVFREKPVIEEQNNESSTPTSYANSGLKIQKFEYSNDFAQ